MRELWRLLAALATGKAAAKGPEALAKRYARKVGHRKVNRLFK